MIDQPLPGRSIEESVRIGQQTAVQFLLGLLLSRDQRFDPMKIGDVVATLQASIDMEPSTAADPMISVAARDTAHAIAQLAAVLRIVHEVTS